MKWIKDEIVVDAEGIHLVPRKGRKNMATQTRSEKKRAYRLKQKKNRRK